MREILFRGKRKDNDQWAQGSLFAECSRFEIVRGTCNNVGIEGVDVIPETVGQYTGLIDKNGKKIFEGDIVAWNNEELNDIDGLPFEDELSVVQFCEERKGYINRGIDIEFVDDFVGFDKNYYRVIGNIHDNPELLGDE